MAEGRRVTANIERVSNLFVTKTVWAALLALCVGLARWPYPFLPRHLSIIDTLTIGVPAFLLALAPNTRRHIPGFVPRVLRFTLPAGVLVGLATFAAYAVAHGSTASLTQQRTAATVLTLALSLGVLVVLSVPLTPARLLLVAAVAAAFAALFPLEPVRRFLDIAPSADLVVPTVAITAGGVAALVAGYAISRRLGDARADDP